MDREETLVAQELATSSENMQRLVEVNQYRIDCMLLTCTVVECIKHSKQCANGKYIIVLVESHLDGLYQDSQSLVLDFQLH